MASNNGRTENVIEFWTADRISQVTSRDFVVDNHGRAFRYNNDGTLIPYGHSFEADLDEIEGPPPRNSHDRKIENLPWEFGGVLQKTVGRILFEMSNQYFICSGTVVTDNTTGRSIILTAAHCIYDDRNKAFATNVLFIPNQDQTTGRETDFDCQNDPVGCWVPKFGVVDEEWANKIFPNNIPWDYGFYVVGDFSHNRSSVGDRSPRPLDEIVGSLPIDFLPPYVEDGDAGPTSLDYTFGVGYPADYDPDLRYCADDMQTFKIAERSYLYGQFWLEACGLTGGASGGPWIQPLDTTTGTGKIISVNSFGSILYSGMGGPRLDQRIAECLFNNAQALNIDGGDVIVKRCQFLRP